jgi:hypothetical protein
MPRLKYFNNFLSTADRRFPYWKQWLNISYEYY